MNQQSIGTSTTATVGRFLEAIASLDLDTVKSVISPDLQVIEPASLPYGGVYHGADAFIGDLSAAIFEKFSLTFNGADLFVGEEGVAAHLDLTFTSRRTDQSLRMPVVEIYDVADGLITKINVFPHDVTAMTHFMETSA